MRKKVISVMLAATMVAALAGCGSKKEDTSSKEQSTVNTEMTADEYQNSVARNADVYKKYVTLPTYKGIEVSVDRSKLDISDDDVNKAIDSLLSTTASTTTVTEGVTADGDSVKLDYCGKLDGEAFSGGTATDATYVIGSQGFISDLDKGLVGLTVGKEYDIPCKFPDDYGTSTLAGKDVIFSVTVKSIDKKDLPELTDQWVADNADKLGDGINTVADLKEYEKNTLKQNAESEFENTKYSSIWDKISGDMEPSGYPEDELNNLVDTFKGNIRNKYNTEASSYGIADFGTYLSNVYGFQSEEQYEEYVQQYTKNYLLEKMVTTLIAMDQNITVSADDINDMGNNLASYYGYNDYQQILDQYGNEMNAEIGYQVLYQKVQQYLLDNSVEA